MVIYRESPNAKEPQDAPQWPPRSPHEALLSSPSGRKRLQRIRDGGSPSPSPRRRPRESPGKAMSIPSSDSEDDEEDEETLQLKLKAIEAKLKLKKLQKAKRSADVSLDDSNSRATSSASTRTGRSSAVDPPVALLPDLQVPLSPVRKHIQPAEAKSPARILLGIDKGVKAQDVSLKRPKTDSASTKISTYRSSKAKEEPRIKSFSERMAESRLNVREQEVKDQRIQGARSQGFGLKQPKEDIFNRGRPAPRLQEGLKVSSGQNIARPVTKHATSGSVKASSIKDRALAAKAPAATAPGSLRRPTSSTIAAMSRSDSQKYADTPSSAMLQPSSDHDPAESSAVFDTYSGVHLSRRQLEHTTLTRTLTGKELYGLPRLLKEVKGPHYEPPDCETDYVVFGVVCSKSTPRDHKNNPKAINSAGDDEHARPKFMVFRLTDFKWEIDLFLFDTGFERWWKLKEGTVIAVLNPGVMPPRNKDSGAFSLKVTSCEDTILEIGQARDLAFCKSIKADGHQCTAWIDKRKTEVCEFHISLQVDKARADRMQFSTMTGGVGRGNGGGARGRGGFMVGRGRGRDGLAIEGKYHNRLLHETMYITPKEIGLNSAALLDQEFTKEQQSKESKRKQEQDRQKEDELARSLGLKGNGTGSEYLKHRDMLKTAQDRRLATIAEPTVTQPPSIYKNMEPPDAASLGLLGKTAQQVSLSPVKRKHGSSIRGIDPIPMGWGGAFKRGLLEPPPEDASKNATQTKIPLSPRKSSMKHAPQQEEGSPRKKARLLLDGKGVRIPGRESLGAKTPGDIFLEDDDDDLEIV